MQAAADITANIPNSVVCGNVSYLPPIMPAIRFPKKLVKNQHPIVNDRNCTGASFDTRESPIGEMQSSAIVITKYTDASHRHDTAFCSA